MALRGKKLFEAYQRLEASRKTGDSSSASTFFTKRPFVLAQIGAAPF
jgi:hypothetical protein